MEGRPDAVPEVLAQVAEPVAAGGGTAVGGQQLGALLAHAGEVAEAGERGGARRRRVHAARHVVLDALLEVKRQLGLHLHLRLGIERAAPAGDAVAHRRHLAQLGAWVAPMA